MGSCIRLPNMHTVTGFSTDNKKSSTCLIQIGYLSYFKIKEN